MNVLLQAHRLSKPCLQMCAHRVSYRCPTLHNPNYLFWRSFSLPASGQQKQISITFLTDVEGDGSYFDRYIENSKILAFQYRKPCFEHSSSVQTRWNLGQWDERYFPYDREVVFLEEDGMLVYGVSFYYWYTSILLF